MWKTFVCAGCGGLFTFPNSMDVPRIDNKEYHPACHVKELFHREHKTEMQEGSKKMKDELEFRMAQTRCTPKEFFRYAHLRQFNHDVDTTYDAKVYVEESIIPEYVKQYLIYLRSRA